MTSPRTRSRLVSELRAKGIKNEDVLWLIERLPRHLLMDEATQNLSYDDAAVPIGYRQTISRPYTVARMTEVLLEKGTPERVLEIGTGSGYQTMVLSQLVKHVYTVERIKPLQDRAQRILGRLKIDNVTYTHSDGGWGWEEHQPYEAIMVTAAPEVLPTKLIDQLAKGGRMVAPIGPANEQKLIVVDRDMYGFVTTQALESASFVPFLDGTET